MTFFSSLRYSSGKIKSYFPTGKHLLLGYLQLEQINNDYPSSPTDKETDNRTITKKKREAS